MLTLSVCIGSSCHIKGSYNVIQSFQQMIEEQKLHDKIEFKANFCQKECHNKGISVTVGEQKYHIEPETASEFFKTEILPLITMQ